MDLIGYTLMSQNDHQQAVDTRQLAKENTFNTSFSSNADRQTPLQVHTIQIHPMISQFCAFEAGMQPSKGRCQKNRIYLGLCPKLWVGGSKGGSKVPNFLVKITIQLFLLKTSRNVLEHVIHKWGGHIWPFHDALRPQRL